MWAIFCGFGKRPSVVCVCAHVHGLLGRTAAHRPPARTITTGTEPLPVPPPLPPLTTHTHTTPSIILRCPFVLQGWGGVVVVGRTPPLTGLSLPSPFYVPGYTLHCERNKKHLVFTEKVPSERDPTNHGVSWSR